MEKSVQLAILKNLTAADQAKSNKSPRFENLENLQTSLTNTFNLSSHFNFTCLSKVNLSFPDELVLVSLPLCHSLSHHVFNYRFDEFRSIFFPVGDCRLLMIHPKVAHAFRVLTASKPGAHLFKANEIACLCGSFAKFYGELWRKLLSRLR